MLAVLISLVKKMCVFCKAHYFLDLYECFDNTQFVTVLCGTWRRNGENKKNMLSFKETNWRDLKGYFNSLVAILYNMTWTPVKMFEKE